MKKLISLFAKNIVVSETPFPKNSRTAPDMVMKTNHDFELEKTRLVDFINRVQKQWEAYFDWRESWGFGKLTKEQRNNLFYKHVDHHLKQFGV